MQQLGEEDCRESKGYRVSGLGFRVAGVFVEGFAGDFGVARGFSGILGIFLGGPWGFEGFLGFRDFRVFRAFGAVMAFSFFFLVGLRV